MSHTKNSIKILTVLSLTVALQSNAWPLEEKKSANNPNINPEKKEMGRLFSQPTERKQLDDLRKLNRLHLPQPSNQKVNIAPQKTMILPKPVTLQGYVKRSDGGKSTVWINHQPLQENSQVNGVNVGKLTQHRETAFGKKASKSIERLEITIPSTGKHVQLKAGQQYEPETNRIKEVTTVAKEKQVLLESVGEDDINRD